MYVFVTNINQELIVWLLQNGILANCPFSIGFLDGLLLTTDYDMIGYHFGEQMLVSIQHFYEQIELYEECADIQDSLECMEWLSE
jgi:hypothetical protein